MRDYNLEKQSQLNKKIQMKNILIKFIDFINPNCKFKLILIKNINKNIYYKMKVNQKKMMIIRALIRLKFLKIINIILD